jgi:hypothetical protein
LTLINPGDAASITAPRQLMSINFAAVDGLLLSLDTHLRDRVVSAGSRENEKTNAV